MTFIILATLTALLVIMTLLPLSGDEIWWIRDLDFPRLQIAIAGLLLLAAELVLLDLPTLPAQIMVSATILCILYQAWWIFPYTRLYPYEVKSAAKHAGNDRIRILAANVLGTNQNAALLLALIRQYQPDLFVTLESNAWWQQQLDILEDQYCYTIKCPLENLYGMHVYSRLPLEDSAIQFLVQPDVPSIHTTVVLTSQHRIQMQWDPLESTCRHASLSIL